MVTEQEYQRLLSQLALMRRALLKTPHGMGDHTDLCRMENQGLPPESPEACRCHVGLINQALAEEIPKPD